MRKIVSFLLVLLMLMSFVPTAFASQTGTCTAESENSQTEIAQDGGLGSLVANSLEEQESGADVDIENKILDIAMDGNIATVSFNNNIEAKIIVAIYDEATKLMLGSGMAEFAEHTDTGEVTIDIETMPEYYVVRAFLLDMENKPLHSSFESIDYTKAHQEFLATTINDFEGETILNFDESEDNNFAVFNEDTIIIDETATSNKLISSDVENLTYVFSDADATLSTLEVGDVFYYTALNYECIAGKVKTIFDDGTYITIVGEEDVELGDVFSFTKINTTGDGEGAVFDTSSADEGVTYEGSYSDSTFAILDRVEKSVKHSLGVEKEFKDEKGNNVKLSATLNLSITFGIEIYKYNKEFVIDFSLEQAMYVEGEISGAIAVKNVNLGEVTIPTGVFGLKVKITPTFVIEFSAKLTFTATIEETKGFRLGIKSGYTDTSKPTKFDSNIQVSGRFYIGIRLKMSVATPLDIAEIGASGEAGAEVTVASKKGVTSDDTKHACAMCTEGAVSGVFKFSVSAGVKFLGIGKSEHEVTLYDKKFQLFNFYISSEIGFGFGSCPNNKYKVTIQVVDSNENPISGANVGGFTTDSNGQVSEFYFAGKQTVTISKFGYQTKNKKLNIKGPDLITVTLYPDSKTSGNVAQEHTGSSIAESGVLNTNKNISWVLYTNGTLVISGSGKMSFEEPIGVMPFSLDQLSSEKYVVDESLSPWKYRDDINKVIINYGVTEIGSKAFIGCDNLTSIDVADSITEISDDAFGGCDSLVNVNLPNSITSFGNGVFANCISLERIDIPVGIKDIMSMTFSGCESLKTINLPSGLTDIGVCTFSGCSSLTNITLPSSLTYIAYLAFDSCTSLKNISIPDSVTNIGWGAFGYCSSLTSVTWPKGVTSIESSLFRECISLKSITLPDTVTYIENSAFSNCTSLTDVYYEGTQSQWNTITIEQNNSCLKSATIHCYEGGGAGSPFSLRDDSELASVGAYSDDLTMVATDTSGDSTTNEYENTVSAQDLVPNNPYVLMVLKGDSSSYTIVTESLLYITDATADEAGNAEFTYYCDDTEDYVAVVFGACNHTLGEWVTITEATENEAGIKAQFCTKCNEAMVSEEIPAINQVDSKFEGASITLGGNLGVNFGFELSEDVVADENAKVMFTLPNGTKQTVYVKDADVTDNGYYIFTCEVNAIQMSSTIKAQVVSTDYESDVVSYSVVEYAEHLLSEAENGNAEYAKYVPLVKAMLNYGAYSQVHFGYATDNLANKNLSEEDKALENISLLAYKPTVTGKTSGVRYHGSSLTLDSETAINLYFIVEDEENIPEFFVNGAAATPVKSGNGYKIEIEDIPAQNLDDEYVVTVGDLTVKYSAFSYGYSAMYLNDANVENVIRALYAYNQAAEALLNTEN